MCNGGEESVIHLMRDCVFASQVWVCVADNSLPQHFTLVETRSWIITNLRDDSQRRGVEWNILFGTTLLNLWQSRNELIFQGRTPNVMVLGRRILCQASTCQQSVKTFSSLRIPNASCVSHREVRWQGPGQDSVKMNCDGSVTNHGEVAGIGGVLRNSEGDFILGFSSNVGSGTITEVELQAILVGIKLVHSCGFEKVVFESDSLVAISLVNKGCLSQHPAYNTVREIQS